MSSHQPESFLPPHRSSVPVKDPLYRYPEAKNPYWKKNQAFEGLVYSDHGTEAHPGQWKSRILGDSKVESQLHVEIGCNAGHVTLEWAARNPAHAYIGIDWKFKAIHRAAEKSQKRKLSNVRFFRAHAERLPYMFAREEIDCLYLFFPDPWPKKAQLKNRFFSTQTLLELAPVVKPGGIFHVKTDHPGYFEAMLEVAQEAHSAWDIQEVCHDLHKGHPHPERLEIPEVTLFEKLFIRDQIPIQSLKLVRKPQLGSL